MKTLEYGSDNLGVRFGRLDRMAVIPVDKDAVSLLPHIGVLRQMFEEAK